MKFSRLLIGAFLDALLGACDVKAPFREGVPLAGANFRPTVQGLEWSFGSSTFGTLLRRHRLLAGLSQEALAERARLSTNGIGALERGYRRTPQRETLALLTGALALNEEQRRVFEAAARSTGSSRCRVRGL